MIAEHAQARQVQLIVIMVIRTDVLDALQGDSQLHGVKTAWLDEVRPLSETDYRQIIDGPLRTVGNSPPAFEEELVRQVLDDCTRGRGTLPLLSLTLARLYKDHLGAGRTLTIEDYGSVDAVVQSLVDKVVSGRRDTDLIRRALLSRLVEMPDGKPTRRAAPWVDFSPEVQSLLRGLLDCRLLVDRRDAGTVEVAFDGLFDRWRQLHDWLDEERENLTLASAVKHRAVEWQRSSTKNKGLLEDESLARANRLLDSELGDSLAEAIPFVAASEHQRQMRRRKTTVVVLAVILACVLALTGGGWAYSTQKQSDTMQRNQTGLRLAAEASQMLDGGRAGGDVLALQTLLVADQLGTASAESVANRRRDLIRIMENPAGDSNQGVTPVRAVAVWPTPKYEAAPTKIATANDDGTVRIWDAASGQLDKELKSQGKIMSVTFSPDGTHVAAGGEEGKMRIWDTSNGEQVGVDLPHTKEVLSIAYSPSGTLIATGSADGNLRIWNASGMNDTPLRQILVESTPGGSVRAVAFRPDANRVDTTAAAGDEGAPIVVTGNDDGVVRFWNAETGFPQGNSRMVDGATTITSIAFGIRVDRDSGEVPRVAVGLIDGRIQVFEGETLEPIGPAVTAHPGVVNSVAFSPGGTRIVSGGDDNTVRVWEVVREVNASRLDQVGGPLIGHHGAVSSVAFNKDATQIVSGGLDGSTRVWDAVTGLPIPAQQGTEVRTVAFNPRKDLKEPQMASGGTDGTVKLWNPTSGAPVGQLGQDPAATAGAVVNRTINVLAYSPDGTRIVTGGQDGALRLWNIDIPAQDLRLGLREATQARGLGVGNRVKGVAFSNDGSLIVTGDWYGNVTLWDGYSLDRVGEPSFVPYQIWSVAFSRDGQRVVTGSGRDPAGNSGNQIKFWRVDRNAEHPLIEDAEPTPGLPGWFVYALAFSPDGTMLASGSNDGITRLWDALDGSPDGSPLGADQNTVASLAFANDTEEPWLASGGADGKIRLWNTERFEPVGSPLDGDQTWIHSVAFSPDDKLVASAGMDGTLHLWRMSHNLTETVCGKINANMSLAEWHELVGADLAYMPQCPGLPGPAGS